MSARWGGRANSMLTLFIILLKTSTICGFEVPPVNIAALKPKGFRASIPNQEGITLFVFQGNINRNIQSPNVGTLTGEIDEVTDNEWVYEDESVQLKVGDVIHYYVTVIHDKSGYIKDGQSFTVAELTDRSGTVSGNTGNNTPDCRPSLTTYRGGSVCSGQVILQEDFNTLNENTWTIEHKIPINHPEYPFVSYQRSSVSVENGRLVIRPKLQEAEPGFNRDSIESGTLNLINSGCTESTEACQMTAFGYHILPPVVSGRVLCRSMAFKYGVVEIRAKLPQGDWLYPELLLEPFIHKYGNDKFASGVIKVAAAAGNRNLFMGTNAQGNELLFGGAIISSECNDTFIFQKLATAGWGDEFHTYSLRWEPERLILSVDGREWSRLDAGENLSSKLPPACARTLMGGRLAPFDTEFYLTLGVAAGGVITFRDDSYSSGRAKPWRNSNSKAKLHFWQDLSYWYPTWGDSSALIVESVKVTAL
ncbi:Beta-1,3-glucan-binding protein [Eumeta japonica]|uniref:Beta-1,3-glucan-binding protein n=1 Tax=Eumeta variegata TaxID=151549 RepID=A0A4C1WHN2_EUMVA|nr:Beta-1,3-glucan-binding protein [Eumeta japonica]